MKLHRSRALVTLIATLPLTACRQTPPAAPVAASVPVQTLREIPSPAARDSGQPNLAVGPAGEIYLSWIETLHSGEPALKFAVRKDDKWSAAQTITSGEQLVVNMADFPSLLPLGGGVLAAHWTTFVPHSEGYNVNIAFSRDQGRTWSKPVIPHRDRAPVEHGFVSMLLAPSGGVGVIWLDSRKLSKKNATPSGSADVAMMYTTVDLDGKVGPEVSIDNRVCECCQPSAVPTANGILAAYRDRTDQEIRDISVVRLDGNKWSAPKNVFADNWKINACPINGPAIAAHENHAAVAWFTAANDQPKVEVAFSNDGGNTFSPPVQVDEGNPAGRVAVAVLDSGSAVVSWVARGDQGDQRVQVRARQIDPDGTRHPSLLVGTTSSGNFPRSKRSGDSVLFTWTERSKDQVLVSALDLKQ
jgi:BNR repeat-like domain